MSAKKARRKNVIPGLEPHGKKWRWVTMFQGKRHRFNLRAHTYEGAVAEVVELRTRPNLFELGAWEAEVTAYIAQGRLAKTISHRNGDNRKSALLLAGKALNATSPRAVTRPMVANWLAGEIARNPGTTTPATYLRHLKSFFQYLEKHGRIPYDPTAGISAPALSKNKRDVFIPADGVARLFDAAREKGDRDLEFILAMGFECGMRRSEIAACRPEWFDLKIGVVNIPILDGRFERKGRAGEKRAATVPLSRRVLEIIDRHGRPSPFVIAPLKDWGKNRYRFEFGKRLRNFLSKYGYAHVTIHDLRRSFASNRVSAGVSIEKVANWMGIDPQTAWDNYARFIPADEEINRGSAFEEKEPEQPATPKPPTSLKDRLAAVEELFSEGLITAEERAAKRASILEEL